MPYKDPEKRKEAQRMYSKRHYESNKKARISDSNERKKKVRVAWRKFKATLHCFECGYDFPEALDFHHVVSDPSNLKVHKLIAEGRLNQALQEIKKCLVLCSNCHRRLHNDIEFEEHILKKAKSLGLFNSLAASVKKSPRQEP